LVLVLRANDIPKPTELAPLGISNTGNTLHNELFISPLRLKAFQRLIANCWSVMNETPLYVSKRTVRSLWQQYRIYRDRIELQSWILLHTVVLPIDEIQAVEVRPSIFGGWKGGTWGIKIDFCDLCRHVWLKRKSGLFKRIGFSPDEPKKFVEICKSILPS